MAHHLSTTIDIDAPPETVWRHLVDLSAYESWNPFIIEAGGVVAEGNRLDLRMQPPGGRVMRFQPTVTAADEGSVFEWLGRLLVPGLFDGRHRFELVPSEAGTRLVQSEAFTGVAVPLFRRSLESSTKAGFEALNEALKQRSEADHGS